MVKPKDILGKYSYVFVLLDDIKLLPSQNPSQNPSQISTRQLLSTQSQSVRQSSSSSTSSSSSNRKNKKRLKPVKFFDLSLLLSIMQRNNLTAARYAYSQIHYIDHLLLFFNTRCTPIQIALTNHDLIPSLIQISQSKFPF